MFTKKNLHFVYEDMSEVVFLNTSTDTAAAVFSKC